MTVLDVPHLHAMLATVREFVDEAIEKNLPVSRLEVRQRYGVAVLTWALLVHLQEQTGDPALTGPIADAADFLQGDFNTHLDFSSLIRNRAPDLELKGTSSSFYTPADISQYTALAFQACVNRQLSVPEGYVDELQRLGYVPPRHRYRPDNPSALDLLPPLTKSVERQPLQDAFLALLPQGDVLQQDLLALLLWVNSRDHAISLNVIDCLTKVREALDTVQLDRSRTASLRLIDVQICAGLEAISIELGLGSSEKVRRSRLFPLDRMIRAVRETLIYTRAWANSDVRIPGLNLEALFWQEFQHLDNLLTHKVYPSLDFEVQFELIMVGALMAYDLSPGSAVSDIQMVAAQHLRVPVDWNWKAFQALGNSGTPFYIDSGSFFCLVQLIRIVQSSEPSASAEDREAALAIARKLAGHVLACCERLNIRLPQHTLIRQYLSTLGYFSALPLPVNDYYPIEKQATLLIGRVLLSAQDAHQRKERLSAELVERALPSSAGHTTVDTDDDTEPPHMQQARLFLSGKRVVLIGGEVHPEREQKLISAFELESLDWIPVDAYTHGTHASHRVTDKADLVLIAIRWIGHAHSTLKDVARAAGVPVVLLPAGLSPHMVAWQVCQQTGGAVKYRSTAIKA
jgi:hypothetical protein